MSGLGRFAWANHKDRELAGLVIGFEAAPDAVDTRRLWACPSGEQPSSRGGCLGRTWATLGEDRKRAKEVKEFFEEQRRESW
ncbi:hypothetical protein P7K49_008251 [Saguinus oedipus]|uniref:Uncharacterized protein n=1 Tax=Saguinus oedipus TaxID=9490 RepID=A0ABQ9VXX5_SAGOE|nr:hypothetical protein P7K49_008251 [Saguinus oedipus]